jgi:hypothetical protein
VAAGIWMVTEDKRSRRYMVEYSPGETPVHAKLPSAAATKVGTASSGSDVTVTIAIAVVLVALVELVVSPPPLVVVEPPAAVVVVEPPLPVVVVVVGSSANAMAHMLRTNAIADIATSDREISLLFTTHPRGCYVPAPFRGRLAPPPGGGQGQQLGVHDQGPTMLDQLSSVEADTT